MCQVLKVSLQTDGFWQSEGNENVAERSMNRTGGVADDAGGITPLLVKEEDWRLKSNRNGSNIDT